MSGSKSTTLGIIGILLGAGGLGLGVLSTINFQVLGTAIVDNWYEPNTMYGWNDAILSNDGWSSDVDDPNAAFCAIFICPQTRSDWKVCIIHRISIVTGSVDILSGILSIGAVGAGEPRSGTNIFNSIDMDLNHPADYTVYHSFSSTFSASVGDWIRVEWRKNDAPSAFAYFYLAFALVHS